MEVKSVSIPIDKKERIITAGIREFAENGYALASTNRICQNAGISKGLLFHYFETKQQFYTYLGNYLAENIKPLIVQILNIKETRFNEFINRVFEIGINFWVKNLDLISFYERVKSDRIFDPMEEINGELKTNLCSKLQSFTEIRKDIDFEIIYEILINDITFLITESEILNQNPLKKKIKEKISIIFEGISKN